MQSTKILAALLLTLCLGGCFQVQLGGSVGEANLAIAPLRDPGNTVAEVSATWGPDFWVALKPEQWADLSDSLQLLFLGIAAPNTTTLAPEQLYLVTASGGTDYDPTSTGAVSANSSAVQGSWHAIATGARIIAGNIQVSPLSEALYLQVQTRLDTLSDAQIIEQLDAAARLVVDDVDGDGARDYNDVLRWSRSAHAALYRGDISAINSMAEAIRAGQPADMLETQAAAVLGKQQLTLQIAEFGTIELETLNWEAPVTADNFLQYVEDSFYNEIIFHRTINNFMIQTGLWELQPGGNTVAPKTTRGNIRNESRYSVSNQRGTLAMARTSDPDSASSQFFINQVDNTFLDHGSNSNPDGYTVFARVTSGLAVVDAIATLPTSPVSGVGSDVPNVIVKIESVTLVD